jgi:chaperonin GroES
MAKKQTKNKKKTSPKKASKAAPKSGIGITPVNDRVLVKPEAAETKTASGIFIPDTAKSEKATIGRVVAAGPGRYEDGKLIPMNIEVGTKVYFNPGWENELEWNGEKYFLVAESDIKAILD